MNRENLSLLLVLSPNWELIKEWTSLSSSSMEKAIFFWGLIAPVRIWPFIPAQESGAFWLFHVMQ